MRYNSICVPILFLFKKKKEKERVQILNIFFSRKIFKKYKRHKDLQYGIEILKQKTVWYNEFANKEDKNHYLHFKLSPAPPDSYLHHTKLIFSTSSLNKIVTWSKNSIIYIYIFVTNCYKIKQWPYTVKKILIFYNTHPKSFLFQIQSQLCLSLLTLYSYH